MCEWYENAKNHTIAINEKKSQDKNQPESKKVTILQAEVKQKEKSVQPRYLHRANFSIYELMAISSNMKSDEIVKKLNFYRRLLPLLLREKETVLVYISHTLIGIVKKLQSLVTTPICDENPDNDVLDNAMLLKLTQHLISGKTYAEKDLANIVFMCLRLDQSLMGKGAYDCHRVLEGIIIRTVEKYNDKQKNSDQKITASDLKLVLYGGYLDILYGFKQKHCDLDYKLKLSLDAQQRLNASSIAHLVNILSIEIMSQFNNFSLKNNNKLYFIHNLFFGVNHIPVDITFDPINSEDVPIFTRELVYNGKFEFCDKSLSPAEIISHMYLKKLYLTDDFVSNYSPDVLQKQFNDDEKMSYDYQSVSKIAYMLKSCAKYFGRHNLTPGANLKLYLSKLSCNKELLEAVFDKFARSYCLNPDGTYTALYSLFHQHVIQQYLCGTAAVELLTESVTRFRTRKGIKLEQTLIRMRY